MNKNESGRQKIRNAAAQIPEPHILASKEVASRIQVGHVVLLGAMMAIGPLSTDMYLPALPVLSHELGATMSQTQITLTATLLGMALGPLLIGPLSDARGRRGPLLIGMSCYVVLSLLCLIAHSIGLLIVLRFAQGFAASAGIVIALAIARDLYAGRALARCVSLLMMVNFLAPIVAPVLGGLLLSFTSWRGVFVSLALFGIALVLVVAFGLSETLPPARRQDGGFSASLAEFRFLLFNGRFVGCALSLGFTFTAIFVYIASSPFIFENIYGLSPQSTSLVFGVIALGIPITAQLNARLLTRISAQELLIWGASAIALGSIALIAAVITGVGLIGVLPSCFLIVTSVGLITPNATALALSKARAAGSASALLGVLQIGLAVVVAPLIGLAGSKSALPMAATIAGSGLATLLTVVVLSRSGKGN